MVGTAALLCALAGPAMAGPALAGATMAAAASPPPGHAMAAAAASPPPGHAVAAAATSSPYVAVAADPAGGRWKVTAAGGVYPIGGAPQLGNLAGVALDRPIVAIAATADGRGYWLMASDGGVFAFGDARFHGSLGGIRLNRPIVGAAATPEGGGYWMVASDGGVFAFGDAGFYGSTGGITLNRPVVGMAVGPGGHGYWMVASDGGVFAFGSAGFHGSTGGITLTEPVTAIATSSSHGYWLIASDGGVFAFGAPFYGASTGSPAPVTSAASLPAGGYETLSETGVIATFGPAGPPPATTPPTTAPPTTTPPVTAPAIPLTVDLTQVGASAEADATWSYPLALAAPDESAVLSLYRLSGTAWNVVQQTGCAVGCTTYRFHYLTPGATYRARVVPIEAGSAGITMGSPPLTVADACPGEVCVSVDTDMVTGPVTHAAQGILHSAYQGSDQTWLTPLDATMYRGSTGYTSTGAIDWTRWTAPEAAGLPTTLVISDAWYQYNRGQPPVPTAAELPAYEQWLTGYLKAVLASGQRVDYFEPYNEPGLNYYPAGSAPVTTAELEQLFLVTYQGIETQDPGARVIGPSEALWLDAPSGTFEAGLDADAFLRFAAANGIQLAAVNFHANDADPADLPDEVADAHRMIASLPALGQPAVFVNEYGAEAVQRTPGWDVGFLSAVDAAGVASAGRSCWVDDCWSPDLDGLLTTDGSEPLPDYWVRRFYASMQGQMVAAATTTDQVSAIASYDPTRSTVSVLEGRGVGCRDTDRCGSMTGPAAAVPVASALHLPWTGGAVHVVGTDITGSSYAATPSAPPASVDETLTVPSSGVIDVTVPAFADGDAWSWTVTPAT